LWDLEKNKAIHNSIDNEYRFVKIKIIDGKLMTSSSLINELPKNLYVKWDITESGTGMESLINQIQNDFRNKFNIEEETYIHNSFAPEITNTSVNKYVFDLSIEKQKEYAILWLTSEGNILNDTEKEDLFTVIDYYNNQIIKNDVPYINWKLIDLEFENILCYNDKQKIIFDKLQGIHGIIAQNNAGKSAIFDILVFSLFGKTTRTDMYSYNDLIYFSDNSEKNTLMCSLQFEDVITKDKYKITRKTNNKTINVIIEKNGIIIHNGSTREANNYITSLLGTYDDFMTITFMAQNSFYNFILMSGKEQKEFTSRIFQLDIYDDFYILTKNDIKKIKDKLKILIENISKISEDTLNSNISKKIFNLKEFEDDKKELELQILNTKKEKDIIVNTIKSLHRDTSRLSLFILNNTLPTKIKNLENLYLNQKIIKEQYLINENLNDKLICFNNEKKVINDQLFNLEVKDLKPLQDEFKNIWKKIDKIFINLKNARGKKVKKEGILNDIKIPSFLKSIKQIDKNIQVSENFLNTKVFTDITEETIDKLTDEVFELMNNKPVEKICLDLEKVKDKYKLNDLENLKINLQNKVKKEEDDIELLDNIINKLKKELINCKYDITVKPNIIDLNKKTNELEKQEVILRKLNEYLIKSNIAKEKLKSHKYNPDCIFCCNNQFIVDAKNDISNEEITLEENKKVTYKIKSLTADILIQENIKNLIELNIKKKEHQQNINDINNALIEYNNNVKLKEKIKTFNIDIDNKNENIKKLKKELKILKAVDTIKCYIIDLKTLKELYINIKLEIKNFKKYNNEIDEIRNILNNKLKNIIEYLNIDNNIKELENDIKITKNDIIIKEENVKLEKENSKIRNSITLLSDLIENNNVKIINIIRNESRIMFELEKDKAIHEDFIQNKKKIKELEKELTILNYFMILSHHNGIPSYLLKQITTLVQDNVNNILLEYSDMKVNIKNEGKETSIHILNNKNKNGLNAKMLCGSEKFLIELAFRVAFQTLSNISKPNFFICDEGWSCLDEKKRTNLDRILKTLLEYNEYILTVSHIDDVKKWMNNYIKITLDSDGNRNIVQ
jgi:DNA repair exonuclease SbcCD ATPase subunit